MLLVGNSRNRKNIPIALFGKKLNSENIIGPQSFVMRKTNVGLCISWITLATVNVLLNL
jgi:hypothetical protein